MGTVSDFLKDAYSAGTTECFNKVVNRWPPLKGLADHGAVVGMKVLERIAARVREIGWDRWGDKSFKQFLKKDWASELNALRAHVESYSVPLADEAMSTKDREERISAYHDIDMCDDFEIYCEYYRLPFHEFGEVYGAKMLRDYVASLTPSSSS